MKCAGWEERIARAEDGAPEVTRHLAACPDCRELAAALDATRAALRDLREEPVDGEVLDRIRGRVMARVAAPRRRMRPWLWLPVPALAAALLLAVLWPRELPEIPPPPAPVAAIPPAPPAPAIRWPRPPVVRAEAHPPLIIRIETDDPGVVIYWIVEGKERGD